MLAGYRTTIIDVMMKKIEEDPIGSSRLREERGASELIRDGRGTERTKGRAPTSGRLGIPTHEAEPNVSKRGVVKVPGPRKEHGAQEASVSDAQ